MPKSKRSNRGSHFSKNSNKQPMKFVGSPKLKVTTDSRVATESLDGVAWKIDFLDTRHTRNTVENTFGHHLEVIDQTKIEKDELVNQLMKYKKETELLEEKISSLERCATLRSKPQPHVIPHYIPTLYTGSRNERNGRPLNLETLRTVAAICASGQQFEKYEVFRYYFEIYLSYKH
jgi:hypothetical protein